MVISTGYLSHCPRMRGDSGGEMTSRHIGGVIGQSDSMWLRRRGLSGTQIWDIGERTQDVDAMLA